MLFKSGGGSTNNMFYFELKKIIRGDDCQAHRPIRPGRHRSTVLDQHRSIDTSLCRSTLTSASSYRLSLLHYVIMFYVLTKLRLDIHWEQYNLSLGGSLLIFSLFMSFIKCFQKVFIELRRG